jgi:hypothetical protein
LPFDRSSKGACDQPQPEHLIANQLPSTIVELTEMINVGKLLCLQTRLRESFCQRAVKLSAISQG